MKRHYKKFDIRNVPTHVYEHVHGFTHQLWGSVEWLDVNHTRCFIRNLRSVLPLEFLNFLPFKFLKFLISAIFGKFRVQFKEIYCSLYKESSLKLLNFFHLGGSGFLMTGFLTKSDVVCGYEYVIVLVLSCMRGCDRNMNEETERGRWLINRIPAAPRHTLQVAHTHKETYSDSHIQRDMETDSHWHTHTHTHTPSHTWIKSSMGTR